MKTVRVDITDALLMRVLRFPEGTRIMSGGYDDATGYIWLVCEHESLPDQPVGVIPRAEPVYERSKTMVNDVDFIEWGVK